MGRVHQGQSPEVAVGEELLSTQKVNKMPHSQLEAREGWEEINKLGMLQGLWEPHKSFILSFSDPKFIH